MEKSKDQRFAKIRNDPRFKPLPKNKKKVQIDKRFEGMFKDPKFKLKYQVDKRGRPVMLSSNDHLKRYYDLNSSEDSSDTDSEEVQTESTEIIKKEKKKKKNEGNNKEGPASKSKELNKKEKNKNKGKKDREAPVVQAIEPNKKGKKIISKSEHKVQLKDGKSKKTNAGTPKAKKPVRDTTEESADESEVEQKREPAEKDIQEDTDEESESDEEKSESEDEEENEDEESEPEEEEDGPVDKLKDLSLDYARGEGVFASDSSDDSEASSAEEEEEEVAHPWGELDADAERTEEVTSRLAICNMDWDRIHAVDLMVLMNSFVPQNASIKSVTIYPSEFGMERMKEEDLRGPKEIADSKVLSSDEDDSVDEYQTEKLRQYQLNRLKYYYAVAAFDSPETAEKVYEECDGMEYESSATKLDLRFVPDDMQFDYDPKEVCTALPDLTRYEPKFFVNTALQQAQVQLTWEENDPLRKANMEKLFDASQKKGGQIDDNVIRQYLATSSEEESGVEDVGSDLEETGDSVAKYRALLADIDKDDKKEDKEMEMEITWGVGLKEKAEKLVEKKLSGKDKLTPWEQYLEKKKEKRKLKKEKSKVSESQTEEEEDDEIPSDVDLNDPYFREEFENNPDFKPLKKTPKPKKATNEVIDSDSEQSDHRKAELELLLGDNEDGRKHFSLKKILESEESGKKKKKGKRKAEATAAKEDDFKIKVDDPRFSALFSSHHYNVDPSDPNFKKTNAMEAILTEKQKRRKQEPDTSEEPPAKQTKPEEKKMDAALSNLVRNVKSKVNTAKLKRGKKF